MSDNTPSPSIQTVQGQPRKRKALLAVMATVFVLAGLAWAAWWLVHGRWFQETDDAYVNGHVMQITPQVGGTVLSVRVEDTDSVKAGDLLVEIDRADARVAMEQAEAALAQAVREMRGVFAGNNTLAAQVRARQTEVDRLRQDLVRRQAIADTGALAMEELYHTRDALKTAEATLSAAQEQLAASKSQTDGIKVEAHPAVQRAAARYEETWLAWQRAQVTAPQGGMVARRNVQVGQRVAAGTPLMTVIPLDQVWVDANFKENQLRHMKVGQPVTLRADVYGSDVEFHGRIAGVGAGTGAAFALLPAQNATGNWIKVVQRVPVRIALDPEEIARHPLRIGLSMVAEVNTRDEEGAKPAPSAVTPVASIKTADTDIEQARARVREIIQQNLAHS
ncbi:HlyD family efflux transporter periplasmic adaptor subunit [Uliginosibacterium paludis]|uniref:HlyD family efflux transporter periplasmic adaptor subunit n=1 Tax=Uliginosibacterium paludis TaxID=1615952 RepID=A0ABV2CR66_9RHOO